MMHKLRTVTIALLVVALLTGCSVMRTQSMRLPERSTIVPGQTISVEGNQNIYAVARQHNVSMRELIVLNNLQPPFRIYPGQTLTLPSGTSSGGGYYGSPAPYGAAPAPSSSPSGSIQAVPLDPIPVVQTAPLPPPPKVEPKPAPAAVPSPPKTTAVDTLNKPVETKPVATTIAPTTNLHTTPPPSLPAPAPTSAPKTEMVWPVQGPVLSAFGGKGQGLSNDGVNIGAPKGAPIVAAQNGIVVYAGNEMKGFGNLILIRHADGWVTAYAHLDRMLVNKDGVVAQGDMIGTVGKTGNVPSPQLHFETRYEGKPIDPSTVIKAQ